MPQWLMYATNIFWCLWFLNEVHSFWSYASLSPYQQKRVVIKTFAKVSFILFFPFSIFWGSYLIWG